MGKELFPIAIYNGPVVTTNGLFRVSDLALDEAKLLLHNNPFISAVGHEATATLLSEIMELNIPMNRISFQQQIGQKAVVFKLNIRPIEGLVLCRSEIEAIGFSFKLIERLE